MPLPRKLLVPGIIISGGKKLSKTIGNVIDPLEIVNEYGVDALRYYLTLEVSSFEDGDFTHERFREVYNANLVNGLGNLVARVMKMAEDHLDGAPEIPENTIPEDFKTHMENFEINKAADVVWARIAELDEYITSTEPFRLVKTDKEKAIEIIERLVIGLHEVSAMLEPLMPKTSKTIKEAVKANKKPENLFARVG